MNISQQAKQKVLPEMPRHFDDLPNSAEVRLPTVEALFGEPASDPRDWRKELAELAERHHSTGVIECLGAMTEQDLLGALRWLRRYDAAESLGAPKAPLSAS